MDNTSRIEDRLAFVQIDSETRDILLEFKPYLEKALPGALEKFYGHIKQWPSLSHMFQDDSRMDYAKKAQQSHWMRLFNAHFDEDYVASVRRIGMVHSKIGLEPTWYIGAYAFTLNHLYTAVTSLYQSRINPKAAAEKTAKLLCAINKCAMIDMDLAISVYLDENKATYDANLSKLGDALEDKIGNIIHDITADSTELEVSAKSLSAVATETSNNASSVAAATEEASASVASVSSATEEMSASIATVEKLATDSLGVATEAVAETKVSMDRILDLNTAIHKINEITNLITTIAEQTNLLALNATIEAARAGEAGKGFAVVAAEVKNLATETAKATEEIRTQVSEILVKSEATVQSIEKVGSVIQNVNTVSRETAESVSQQKLAIDEIARNIDQASAGTHEIARNITTISLGANNTGTSSNEVLAAAARLAARNRELESAVHNFIQEIKK